MQHTWNGRVFIWGVNTHAHAASVWMTESAVPASSPVVGSSRKMMLGLMMSSIPTFVLFRSPPDTPRMTSVPTYREQVYCQNMNAQYYWRKQAEYNNYNGRYTYYCNLQYLIHLQATHTPTHTNKQTNAHDWNLFNIPSPTKTHIANRQTNSSSTFFVMKTSIRLISY